jgi:hypothetical protein
VVTCGGADGQWRKVARTGANLPWLRGNDLSLHAGVTDPSAQWQRRGPRTGGHSDVSACARNWGTASRRGITRRDVVRGSAGVSNTVSFSPLQLEFSPKIRTEVLPTLNTKVVKQVTLYKNAKGSWVV